MRRVWLACAALAWAVRGGEPDCTLDGCYWSFDDHLFGDAKYLLDTGRRSTLQSSTTYGYLLPHLCNAQNWRRSEQCLLECPLALEITSPAHLRMRACVADNAFTPFAPDAHLDSTHPLNNQELELVAVGGAGSTAREACDPSALADGRNYSGKIVLVKRGGCAFVLKAAAVQTQLGAATVIVDHSASNHISFSGISGSSQGIESMLTVKMSRHFGQYILDAMDAGETVRGRFSLSCAAFDATVDDSIDVGCPDVSLTGMCGSMPSEADQLCAKCPVELYMQNSTDPSLNISMCLWDHLMLPRAERNSFLQSGATSLDVSVTLADSVPGFAPDPNCRDNEYTEPLTGYTCRDIAGSIAAGQLPSCAWLLQLGFPAQSTAGFMQNCFVTCPRSVGGVGCPGGTGEGCDARDFVNAGGKVIAVQRPEGCLPIELLRYAESRNVTGVIIMTRSGDSRQTLVEGLSSMVGIPVHAVSPWGTGHLTSWLQTQAAQTGGALTVTVRHSEYAPPPSPTPAPTPPPQLELIGVTGSEDFEFTDSVIIALVAASLLFVLNVVVFTFQRINSVSLPRQGTSGSNVSIPLSAASMGLSLSLLMIIAVVSFTLTYRTGKETTDTALDDGWNAVGQTHANAVLNVEQLKDQLLKSIVDRVEQGVNSRLSQGITAVQKLAKLFLFQDGTWATFDQTVPYVTELSQGAGVDTDWSLAVRTVEGFYAAQLLKSDDRPNASRLDPNPHISVTNNGRLYGTNRYSYKPGGNLFSEEVPREVWDPMTNLGREAGFDVNAWMTAQSAPNLLGVWFATRYASPVPSAIYFEYGRRPLHCVCAFSNSQGRYVGTAQAWMGIERFGTFLGAVATSRETVNMSIVVFDSVGEMITASRGRSARGIDGYADNLYAASSDEISLPIHVEFSHTVELNAVANFIKSELLQGSLSNLSLITSQGMRGQFNQREWYGKNGAAPQFTAFKFTFDGQSIADESGEGWQTTVSGTQQFSADGVRGSGSSLRLDGSSSLDVHTYLTTNIPRVAMQRNTSLRTYNPSYATTMMHEGRETVAVTRFDENTRTTALSPLTREPLLRQSFTIAMWMRPDGSVSDSRTVTPTTPRLFSDTFNSPASVRVFANGKLVVTGPNGGYGCETDPIPGGPPAGQWTHIAASVDRVLRPVDALIVGTSLQVVQMCTVYVNGRVHSRKPLGVEVTLTDSIELHPEPYRFGQFFTGQLDDVIFFNNTLTEAEVRTVMDDGRLTREVPSREWYVQVTRVQSTLLDWGVAAYIPRSDIMREVDTLNELQRQNQTIQRKNTENKLSQSSAETMLIITAIAMASILIFLVFNEMLTRPFAIFARQMTDVAVMKVEDVETHSSSVLREIDSMHRAMTLMVRNLKEYKSYMPQTMLAMNDSTSEDEGDGSSESKRSSSPKKDKVPRDAISRDVSDDGTPKQKVDASSFGSKASGISSKTNRSSLAGGNAQTQVSHNIGRARKAEAAIRVGSLMMKRCSFVCVNVTDFHTTAEKLPTDTAIVQLHAHVMEMFLSSFQMAKGVPDTFCGDRVLCSFNAVKVNGSHRTTSCTSVITARAKMKANEQTAGIKFSASVVAGETKVGNMGTDFMRRFTYVSSVVTWGVASERYCRSIGALSVVDSAVKEEATNNFILRLVDGVNFPKRKRSRYLKVYELLAGRTGAAEEEWMYQLDKQESETTWKAWDTCVEAVLKGDWGAAAEHAEKALATDKLGDDSTPSDIGQRLRDIVEAKEYSVPTILHH